MTKKTFIIILVISFSPFFTGVVFAGQMARQFAVDYLNAQRVMSPDEQQLAGYLAQRALVYKSMAKKRPTYALRQKLKVLNNKISYLESEIKQKRKSAVSAPKKSVAAPATKPVKNIKELIKTKSTAELPKKSVTAVKPRVIVREKQRKIDQTPVWVAAAKPELKTLTRESKIKLASVAAPAITVVSAPTIARPINVTPVSNIQVNTLSLPAQMPKPDTISPLTETPRPTSVIAGNIESPVLRSPAQVSVKSQVVETHPDVTPIQENIAVTPVVEVPQPAPSPTEQKSPAKMGSDWLAMSQEDKEMYVFSAMGALVKHDVVSMKPSYFYIQVLDTQLSKNPSLKDHYLDDVFISSIYENEPDTRTAIDKIRR